MSPTHPRKEFFIGNLLVMMNDGNRRNIGYPRTRMPNTEAEIGILRAVKDLLVQIANLIEQLGSDALTSANKILAIKRL